MKLFDPCGRWTYFVIEYDPTDRLLYGFCRSPLGPDCDELGYASLDEIEATTNRLGLGMERDLYWTPIPLSKVRADRSPDSGEDRPDPGGCPECGRSFGPHYRGPCEHGGPV